MIQVKAWEELTKDELFEIVCLRSEVFFVEQRADTPDFDAFDRDPRTRHWWVPDVGGCAAYLRTVELDEPELGVSQSFGRVAVRADRRGEGLARRLIAAALGRLGKNLSSSTHRVMWCRSTRTSDSQQWGRSTWRQGSPT
jgi:putative acyltransferase